MIGRRPCTSLRRPHHGLTTTQMLAEVAKMVDTWNGVMPIARAAGGRMLNSIDCPMPMQTRQRNSVHSARACGDAMLGRVYQRVAASHNPRGATRILRVLGQQVDGQVAPLIVREWECRHRRLWSAEKSAE